MYLGTSACVWGAAVWFGQAAIRWLSMTPNSHFAFSLWPGCDTLADAKEAAVSWDCSGWQRTAAEPTQCCLYQPHAAADPAGCFCAPKTKCICRTFCSKCRYFGTVTLHCSLTPWVYELLRLREPSCLLFPLSLSHDFLLKAWALRQSVRFNILFKLNVLGWPNQMLAGWPQEWEPRYSVI